MADDVQEPVQEQKEEQQGTPAHLVDEKRPERDEAVDTISGNVALMDTPKLADEAQAEAADEAGKEPAKEAAQEKVPEVPPAAAPQQHTGKIRSSDDPRFHGLQERDRVNILVRERYEAQRKADAEAAERARLERELAAMRAAPPPPPVAPQAPAAPAAPELPVAVRPDVQDPAYYTEDGDFVREKWDAALLEYERKTDEARERRLMEAIDRRREDEKRAEEERQRIQASLRSRDEFLSRESQYRAEHPDYGDAAENLRPLLWDAEGRPRNPALAFFAMHDPDALPILHGLGQDLGKAENYVKADALTLGMMLAQDKAAIAKAPPAAAPRAARAPAAPVPPTLSGTSRPAPAVDNDFVAYAKSRGLGHLVSR